jgi:hypothetical protein
MLTIAPLHRCSPPTSSGFSSISPGRKGQVWGAESIANKLFVLRTE